MTHIDELVKQATPTHQRLCVLVTAEQRTELEQLAVQAGLSRRGLARVTRAALDAGLPVVRRRLKQAGARND